MSLLDSFMTRAALAGLGVSLAAGPLGCFVVWRRMAYFGDAMAHAAVLGVALALGLEISIFAGVLVVALGAALIVNALSIRGFAADTVLGVLAHGALAFGLVSVALIPGVRVDLEAFLFGDILATSRSDLLVIWTGGVLVVGLLAWRWQALLTATLNPDLAHAAGINPSREHLILTLALAVVVAVAIKVVGALLIGALLVIPGATARPLARSPEAMAAAATTIGALSALLGLWASYLLDTPTGPTIVSVAVTAFVITTILSTIRNR